MLQVVGQLVELAQAPGRQGAPATGAHAAGVVVQAFSIAEEQVHEQEDQQKGGDEQVEDGCLPAPTPGQPAVKTDRGISRPSMLYACYQATVYCRQTGKATHRPETKAPGCLYLGQKPLMSQKFWQATQLGQDSSIGCGLT